jgi:hypothetical protein
VPAQWLAVVAIGIALGLGVPVLVSELGDGDNSAPEPAAVPSPTDAGEPAQPNPSVPTPARTAPPETETRLPAGSRRLYRFEGTGPRSLPRLRIRRNAVLRWTSSGGPLEINSSSFQFNASAMRGQTPIPRGDYRGLEVSATGPWTLDIRTR